MSDTSQGPGWWQASDGKWYPPEQAPGATSVPPAAPQSGYGAPQPGYGAPQPGYPPAGAGGQVAGTSAYGNLASWGQRAMAIVIDWGIGVVAWIVAAIVIAIISAISSTLGALVGLIVYLALTVYWFYIAFMNGTGASPGKKLTGLKVVSMENGQPIGGGMGIVRGLAHIIDSLVCYIGWFMPLWDSQRQTIADKIIKTYVLADQPKQDFSLEIFKP